jgi:hypothetical protein
MSRNIPKVRRWIVNYWRDGKCWHTEKVDTVNKRFARWIAAEQSDYAGIKSDKITVSLLRQTQAGGKHV